MSGFKESRSILLYITLFLFIAILLSWCSGLYPFETSENDYNKPYLVLLRSGNIYNCSKIDNNNNATECIDSGYNSRKSIIYSKDIEYIMYMK